MSQLTRHCSLAGRSTARILVLFLVLSGAAGSLMIRGSDAQGIPAGAYVIDGRVVESDQAPLKNATVALSKSGSAAVANATTDAEGKYRFTQLAEGTYDLVASHACCLPGKTTVTVSGFTLLTTAADIVLEKRQPVATEKTALISGTATDKETGKRLANVYLEIYNSYGATRPGPCPPDADCAAEEYGTQQFTVLTGADGTYEVRVNQGHVNVIASLFGYQIARTERDVSEDARLDVPMLPAEGQGVTIRGVLKGDDGKVIPGARVEVGQDLGSDCGPNFCSLYSSRPYQADGWIYEEQGMQWNSTVTGKDGSWEMRTFSGKRIIQAFADHYLPGTVRVDVKKGETRDVALVLERIPDDSVRLFGKVIDAKTGKPLPYASLSLENQKWGAYNYTDANQDGTFELWAKPGYSLLTVNYYRHDWGCYEAEASSTQSDSAIGVGAPVRPMPCSKSSDAPDRDYYPRVVTFFAPAQGEKELNFELKARPDPASTFQGYVVDASSQKGVPNATVMFFNEATRDWGSALTDADGSYRIRVHAGYYSIRVEAEHYFVEAVNAEIEEKEENRLDLTMEPGERRYGYYYSCDACAVDSVAAHGAPSDGSASASGSDSSLAGSASTAPTAGARVYAGEGGGLGPFDPNDIPQEGAAPGLPVPLVALGVIATVALLGRRRRA